MLKEPVLNHDHIQGSEKAPITLVEYGDYQCPYCGEAYPIVKQVQEHFGAKLRFVFRNFPLSEVHPLAEPAAQTAEFAGSDGLFWEMHDLLYENQEGFSIELFLELATSLGLSSEKLNEVLVNHTYQPKIHKDFMSGVRSGVNGTPTFFINDHRYLGPIAFEGLLVGIADLSNL